MSSMLPYDADNEIGEFDYGDLGNIPQIDKNEYNGKVIIVTGVSDGKFEGEFDTPARSILHYMPENVVFTSEGHIGGFRTKAGDIISNADAALPMPERKPRSK